MKDAHRTCSQVVTLTRALLEFSKREETCRDAYLEELGQIQFWTFPELFLLVDTLFIFKYFATVFQIYLKER